MALHMVKHRRWDKSLAWMIGLGLASLAVPTLACFDPLVARGKADGSMLVIGDYGCYYPQPMIFLLDPAYKAPDGSLTPQGVTPFASVCKQERNGGFRCGSKAPFGLAGSRWKPESNDDVSDCKTDSRKRLKYACVRGCKGEAASMVFVVEAYECD